MKAILAALFSFIFVGCTSNIHSVNTKRIPSSDLLLLQQEQLRKAWAPTNFSNPLQHEDTNYLYLVHASAQVDFYDKVAPQRQLSNLGRLSTSVISQNHVGTFRNAGVILEVPQSNFIAASDEDMGKCESGNEISSLKECFVERFNNFGLPSPQKIVELTMKKDPTYWNEVLVSESPLALQDPKITALFLRADSFGNCLAEIKLCQKLEEMSVRYNYPLIKIPPPQNEIWLIGYPQGGKVTRPFGYFVREPPFEKVNLKITEDDFKKLQDASRRDGKALYITSAEFIYGATPVGVVVDNNFFHITSKSDFGTIKKSDATQEYTFSKKATPIIFLPK